MKLGFYLFFFLFFEKAYNLIVRSSRWPNTVGLNDLQGRIPPYHKVFSIPFRGV